MFSRLRRATGDLIFLYISIITGYWVVQVFRQAKEIICETPIPYVTTKAVSPRDNYTGYNETPFDS